MTTGRTETGTKNGPPKNNQEKDSPLAPQGLTCSLPAPKEGSVSPVSPSDRTEKDALRLIQTAISRLGRYDLNLCKVQSNTKKVREAYPPQVKVQAETCHLWEIPEMAEPPPIK